MRELLEGLWVVLMWGGIGGVLFVIGLLAERSWSRGEGPGWPGIGYGYWLRKQREREWAAANAPMESHVGAWVVKGADGAPRGNKVVGKVWDGPVVEKGI